jgi:acetate kinase
MGKTILVINAGSSSVKFRAYREDDKGYSIIIDGVVDRIGPDAVLEVTKGGINTPEKNSVKIDAMNHSQAGVVILDQLHDTPPNAVIHRVVYGADHKAPAVIDDAMLAELKSYIPLAPLHMPPSIALIEFLYHRLGVKSIACFDTMFHAGMPDVARNYALRLDLVEKYSIVRRGFHGLAHEAMAQEAAKRFSMPLEKLNIITCQLGNGASLCAIKEGKSIDTSMGFTPLEGLVMGTRCGDIDAAVIPFLCEHEKIDHNKALHILEQESGLKGITGVSDVRDILSRENSDPKAKFALDIMAYRIRKYIGAYYAVLGRVDAIVLGGGLPRSIVIRRKVLF